MKVEITRILERMQFPEINYTGPNAKELYRLDFDELIAYIQKLEELKEDCKELEGELRTLRDMGC